MSKGEKQLKLKITNHSGLDDSEIHIGFWQGSQDATQKATVNGVAMENINSDSKKFYSLKEFTDVIVYGEQGDSGAKTSFSGRLYFCYGSPFAPTVGADGNFGMPSPVAPTDPYYTSRYDKIELTFDGSNYSVADLTIIDFWSIPMSMQSLKNGKPAFDGNEPYKKDGINSGTTAAKIYEGLKELSSPMKSTQLAKDIIAAFEAADNPIQKGVIEQMQTTHTGLVEKGSEFVRFVGPNTYPDFGDPTYKKKVNGDYQYKYPGIPFIPYDTFYDYFEYLVDTFGPGKTNADFPELGNGKIAKLSGTFVGNPGPKCGGGDECKQQKFTCWASVDSDMNLTISGTMTVGDKKAYTMTIPKWTLLSPPSAFGGNPDFSLNGAPPEKPQNNLYAHILGDFFCGLNIGAIGSPVTVDGTKVGNMISEDWFSKLAPDKDAPSKSMLFSKLWAKTGKTNFWNQWAEVLNTKSQAYNFAYAERFSNPLLSIRPEEVDTLEIILLSHQV